MKANLLYLLVFFFATGLNLAAQDSDKDLNKAKKHLAQALEYLVSKGDIRAATFMDALKADFPDDPAFANVLRKTDRMMAEAKAAKDKKKKNANNYVDLDKITGIWSAKDFSGEQVETYLKRNKLIGKKIKISATCIDYHTSLFFTRGSNFMKAKLQSNSHEVWIDNVPGYDVLEQPVKKGVNFSFEGVILREVQPGPFDDPTVLIFGKFVQDF